MVGTTSISSLSQPWERRELPSATPDCKREIREEKKIIMVLTFGVVSLES